MKQALGRLVFHLPGQHDQKSHGGSGGLGGSDPSWKDLSDTQGAPFRTDGFDIEWAFRSNFETLSSVLKSTSGRDIDPQEFLKNTWGRDLGDGTRLVITTVGDSPRKDKVAIIGRIMNGDREIGEFHRVFHQNGVVRHGEFRLYDDAQNQGIGVKVTKHAESEYRKAGFKSIQLEANSEVGGYAWARMGFDFADDIDRKTVKIRLQNRYRALTGTELPESDIPNHSWEIAAFLGPGGERLGRSAMLGSGWDAQKDLDPDSLGSRIGSEYYKLRGIE